MNCLGGGRTGHGAILILVKEKALSSAIHGLGGLEQGRREWTRTKYLVYARHYASCIIHLVR